MEEGNNAQALEKISSEVDDSQIKVILSSQCIKAQVFLLDKLKKQSERHKQTCSFISSANLKVDTEIKHAEQEIRSMLIAQETLKCANVEIRKEWLLAKNRKADIMEHVVEGKRKYEDIYLECKTRYESIPFVQKLLQSIEKQKITEETINDLEQQITKLYNDIEIRRKQYAELNVKRAVELANFMIHERPKAIKVINEKLETIKKLKEEIELLLKEQDNTVTAIEIVEPLKLNEARVEPEANKKDDTSLSKWEDDPLVPKLNLHNFDLDMDINLDQIKKKKEILKSFPIDTNSMLQDIMKNVESQQNYEYMISPYFQPIEEVKRKNFSERKLINILEDININTGDVYNFVKKVNPEQLKPVAEISAENGPPTTSKDKENKLNESIISEKIEEIDLTGSSNTENIPPPTQFLDITFSDDIPRKRVCFDLPSSIQINVIDDDKDDNKEDNNSVNQTISSQLDVSADRDECSMKIKQILLKKQNLDLSPQFVYAKNNILQKKDDEKIVSSKFFDTSNVETIKVKEHQNNEMDVDEQPKSEVPENQLKLQGTQLPKCTKENILMPMDVDKVINSSPQTNKVNLKYFEEPKSERKVSGLLFTHGAQEIPDSLNVSMSTTGYEDSDFPHCIDSSLLLSPKGDAPVNGDNPEGLSQGIPNFLSGFRNLGSFFGGTSSSSEPKPASSGTHEGFSFNFGGEKKNRGGLFSLFQ